MGEWQVSASQSCPFIATTPHGIADLWPPLSPVLKLSASIGSLPDTEVRKERVLAHCFRRFSLLPGPTHTFEYTVMKAGACGGRALHFMAGQETEGQGMEALD